MPFRLVSCGLSSRNGGQPAEELMDYELQRCTRHCASKRPGSRPRRDLLFGGAGRRERTETLRLCGGSMARSAGERFGWWKSQIPNVEAKRAQWAPNEVMLQFFEQLADQPERQDVRYVLALLLVRRRVMRVERRKSGTTRANPWFCIVPDVTRIALWWSCRTRPESIRFKRS